MGTTQLNSEFGETFAEEKNVHSGSKVEQNTNKHGNESGSEPEIYLLVSHRGRKHDHRGGRRIGLFGPFGPRGPKGFGFPFHEGPHRGGHHPHGRHDGVEMRGVRRGPPHARGFRHERDEEFAETSERERGHSPHRGMRRGPPHARGFRHERDEEFAEKSEGEREHGHSPHRSMRRGPPHAHGFRHERDEEFAETSEDKRERGHSPHRGMRRGPPHARGFRHERDEEFAETSEGERGHSPHRGMRRFGPGPHGKRGPSLERGSEFHREPRHHGGPSHRPRGFGPRGGSRGRFETEERVHTPHHHHRLPREHGRGPRGDPRDRSENEERIHHHPREHGHGPHLRGHGIGPRERFETEENVKQFHRRKPENHEHSPRRHGHGQHQRFEAEGNTKEFHGKHGRHGGHPSLENEHGRGGERGHSPRGRFEKESEYFSDSSERRGPRGHGFGPRDGQRFEHDGHGSDAGYKTRHRRGERARDGPESDYESDYPRKRFDHRDGHRFGNGIDFRGGHRLRRGGPRLHHHVPRHRMFRGPCFPHRHHSKPLTPEELAEKVALLNSMGFPAENNSHYEELLKKFNGRIGRVIEILLRERKKDEDDKDKENDDKNGGNEEEGDEDEKTPVEDYDIYDIVEQITC